MTSFFENPRLSSVVTCQCSCCVVVVTSLFTGCVQECVQVKRFYLFEFKMLCVQHLLDAPLLAT